MIAIKRTYKIIAVDFDGTLCEACYPDIGKANISLIEYLKQQRLYGNKIILWTCRANKQLTEAVEWCSKQGLVFDAINSNLQEVITAWTDGESRKIYADIYIDDKAMPVKEFKVPAVSALHNIRKHRR